MSCGLLRGPCARAQAGRMAGNGLGSVTAVRVACARGPRGARQFADAAPLVKGGLSCSRLRVEARRTLQFADVAQLVEREPSKLKVAGFEPRHPLHFCHYCAQSSQVEGPDC